jgi:alkylated DNA nucleotide flippase Atl1
VSGSPHYARIKGQILHILAQLAPGQVVLVAEVASALAVPPRHVAYILATLTEPERMVHAWHRAVGPSGAIGAHKRRDDQIEGLRRDGIAVVGGRIVDLQTHCVAVERGWVIGPTQPF